MKPPCSGWLQFCYARSVRLLLPDVTQNAVVFVSAAERLCVFLSACRGKVLAVLGIHHAVKRHGARLLRRGNVPYNSAVLVCSRAFRCVGRKHGVRGAGE